MHERPFTEEIVTAIRAALKDYPDAVIKRVRVRVGEIYHLVPDSVRAHFEQISVDTGWGRPRLELEEEELVVRCDTCDRQGKVDDHHLPACGHCGSTQVKPIAGDKIVVEEIEAES